MKKTEKDKIPQASVVKDEEIKAIERLKNGEQGARIELIELNVWVAEYVASRYVNVYNSFEDLVSVAFLGLVKAMNRYDPHKNVKPSTFAIKCARNEILMYLRSSNKKLREVSLEKIIADDPSGSSLSIADTISTGDEAVLDEVMAEEIKEIINGALDELDKDQRLIMELRFGLNGKQAHTQSEIADILGTSQSYVSKKEKALLAKLENILQTKLI